MMPVLGLLIMNPAQKAAVDALYDERESGNLIPVSINNPLANQLGQGAIRGTRWAVPARVLNDPDYSRYVEVCSTHPIHTWDSDVIFLPPQGDP